MENELTAALAALGGDNGTVVQVMAWMASARVVFKIFSGRLQSFLERSLAYVVASNDDGMRRVAEAVLGNAIYKLTAWFVDAITSIKLPLKLPEKGNNYGNK